MECLFLLLCEAIWLKTGPLTSAPCLSHLVSPSPTLLCCDWLVLILQCLLIGYWYLGKVK